MKNLNQKLMELFQMSDGLLLPDESTLNEISRKQQEIEAFGEGLVHQGFIAMRDYLQELAGQNKDRLMVELNWTPYEKPQSRRTKSYSDSPSLWELTRHLSNWMKVLSFPIQALDMQGETELIQCFKSREIIIATLAAMILGFEEFHYLGSRELFIELLNTRRQSMLRLELCRLLYIRFHDPEALRYELVPAIIENDSQFDEIITNNNLKKKLLSFIRELVVWDIVTNGEGPYKRWSGWWIRSSE